MLSSRNLVYANMDKQQAIRQNNIDWQRIASGVPPSCWHTHTFGKFDSTEDNKEAMQAAMTIMSWEDTKPLLMLIGECGLGKTHLALAAGLQAVANGYVVRYYPAAAFVIMARQVDSILDLSDYVNLMIIDDLGVQADSAWAASQLDMVIDHRYLRSQPTIITANTLEMSDRIRDRMKEGRIVRIRGESRRGNGLRAEAHESPDT